MVLLYVNESNRQINLTPKLTLAEVAGFADTVE
jgi:hypothetical protein